MNGYRGFVNWASKKRYGQPTCLYHFVKGGIVSSLQVDGDFLL
jgi:hypothetical protein